MGTRRTKTRRLASDSLEVQGPKTWIEIPRKLAFAALRPVIELSGLRDDQRLQAGAAPDEMVDALAAMILQMRDVLAPLVLRWNWATDMDAAITSLMVHPLGVTLGLETPIQAASSFEGVLDDLVGLPLYVGEFPDVYVTWQVVAVENGGKTLVAAAEIPEPPELFWERYADGFVVVGYPEPQTPGALDWLDLEELVWIVNALAAEVQATNPKVRR